MISEFPDNVIRNCAKAFVDAYCIILYGRYLRENDFITYQEWRELQKERAR